MFAACVCLRNLDRKARPAPFGCSCGQQCRRDFYTCVSLLKEPTRTKLQDVIRQVAQARLEMSQGDYSSAKFDAALDRFDRLHARMTELVDQALRDGTPIAVSLANTLNAVSSNQTARLSAYRDRLPATIVLLLSACAIVTALLIGREQGKEGNPDIAGTLCFILLVSIAFYVTLDLNRPDRGLVRVSQEPMIRLLSTMSR